MKERKLKRLFDIIVSAAGIIIFLPMLVLIALLIKIESLLIPSSKGPILHSENRVSRNKVFRLYKFRTVKGYLLQEVKKKPDYISQSTIQHRQGALTNTGKFLAKFYLDELPQIYNILKGDMSFVGPRPQLVSTYNNRIKAGDRSLQFLKAGLCGLPQACKRNKKLHKALIEAFRTKETHSKIRYLDGIYLANYTKYSALKMLFYDLDIMFMTLKVNLKGEGLKIASGLYTKK
jgi:lipopolysaccharide/colanic/teichoic acid biosynthesis glycosyltransferase